MPRVSLASAAAFSLGLVGATLAPVVRAPDDDGFPLSTYPMFATPRPRTLVVSYARGVDRAGEPHALAPALLGTGEVLQALVRVSRAISAGVAASAGLCAAIADRVAADPARDDLVAIELVTGAYDAVAALTTGAAGEILRHARCAVNR